MILPQIKKDLGFIMHSTFTLPKERELHPNRKSNKAIPDLEILRESSFSIRTSLQKLVTPVKKTSSLINQHIFQINNWFLEPRDNFKWDFHITVIINFNSINKIFLTNPEIEKYLANYDQVKSRLRSAAQTLIDELLNQFKITVNEQSLALLFSTDNLRHLFYFISYFGAEKHKVMLTEILDSENLTFVINKPLNGWIIPYNEKFNQLEIISSIQDQKLLNQLKSTLAVEWLIFGYLNRVYCVGYPNVKFIQMLQLEIKNEYYKSSELVNNVLSNLPSSESKDLTNLPLQLKNHFEKLLTTVNLLWLQKSQGLYLHQEYIALENNIITGKIRQELYDERVGINIELTRQIFHLDLKQHVTFNPNNYSLHNYFNLLEYQYQEFKLDEIIKSAKSSSSLLFFLKYETDHLLNKDLNKTILKKTLSKLIAKISNHLEEITQENYHVSCLNFYKLVIKPETIFDLKATLDSLMPIFGCKDEFKKWLHKNISIADKIPANEINYLELATILGDDYVSKRLSPDLERLESILIPNLNNFFKNHNEISFSNPLLIDSGDIKITSWDGLFLQINHLLQFSWAKTYIHKIKDQIMIIDFLNTYQGEINKSSYEFFLLLITIFQELYPEKPNPISNLIILYLKYLFKNSPEQLFQHSLQQNKILTHFKSQVSTEVRLFLIEQITNNTPKSPIQIKALRGLVLEFDDNEILLLWYAKRLEPDISEFKGQNPELDDMHSFYGISYYQLFSESIFAELIQLQNHILNRSHASKDFLVNILNTNLSRNYPSIDRTLAKIHVRLSLHLDHLNAKYAINPNPLLLDFLKKVHAKTLDLEEIEQHIQILKETRSGDNLEWSKALLTYLTNLLDNKEFKLLPHKIVSNIFSMLIECDDFFIQKTMVNLFFGKPSTRQSELNNYYTLTSNQNDLHALREKYLCQIMTWSIADTFPEWLINQEFSLFVDSLVGVWSRSKALQQSRLSLLHFFSNLLAKIITQLSSDDIRFFDHTGKFIQPETPQNAFIWHVLNTLSIEFTMALDYTNRWFIPFSNSEQPLLSKLRCVVNHIIKNNFEYAEYHLTLYNKELGKESCLISTLRQRFT